MFVKRSAREGRSSQRGFCHSSAAGDTRGRRPQTSPGCARRHRSRQTHRRGSPTLSTAAGWEAQETPGSRRNPPGTGSPPAGSIRNRPRGPNACASRRLSKNPQGRGYLAVGGSSPARSPAGTAYALTLSLGAARRQELRGPGRGAVWGAAVQGRGAKAAAMASHVRRLKLYPEPQTGGAEGTELRGGPHPRARPRPPTDQSLARGGHTRSRPLPSLIDPGKGRVLKEPRLAESSTVGIWENPSLGPKRRD